MNKIKPFALERYFAKHEFSAQYLLSSSDCEAMALTDLLSMADGETKFLWDGLRLGYTESQGHPHLRQEISTLYEGLSSDEIVVSVPEEGIFLFMYSILNPGDHVVTTFPGYQSLYEIAASIGCSVTKWEPDETAGWTFDLKQLRALLRPETKLLVVNFPHNPTGFMPSVEDFNSLMTIVRERNLYLFSDEMYRFLEFGHRSPLPSACTQYVNAFSLFGMSKTFGLPGLRIGWVASQNREVLNRIIELKDYTTICNSAPSEILSLGALQNRKVIINQQKRRLNQNLKILSTFMEQYDDHFHWIKPAGSSVCFPKMLKVKSTLGFCNRLVAKTGIMLLPSYTFQYGDRHVRIGFGKKNFKDVLTRFGEYLDSL